MAGRPDSRGKALKNIATWLLTALLCLGAGLAAAQSAAPAEDIYLEAMRAISEARQADAGRLLERMVEQGPVNAGEWLDLAMVQCALGHKAEAEELFRRIEGYLPPPGILDIIAQQRRDGCQSWAAHQQWALTVARGADSNVNQGASNPFFTIGDGAPLQLLPEYQPHSDRYTVLSGDYQRELDQDGDTAYFEGHVHQNDHQSLYNTVSGFAGIDHPMHWGDWRLGSAAQVGLLTLGGQLYQEQALLQLRATPPLPLPEPLRLDLSTSYSRTDYKTLSNFNASTWELRSQLNYHKDALQGLASLGYQYDLGHNNRPGGDRQGWSARLFGHGVVAGEVQAELDWSLQDWHGSLPYSPGLIDTRRDESTRTLRAALIYPLSTRQALHLEWRQVRNGDNISIFQYDSRSLQLSWHWYGL